MKRTNLIKMTMLASLLTSPMVMADNSFTADQKKEVEQIIHNYIVQNPEVLVEASQALQHKQQEMMQQEAKTAIQSNAAQLFQEKLSVAGNPHGSVTLVEFFDYQCAHCKKMSPVIDALIKANPNLRVIYKEFPIFGESSEGASKAALAASMQGKYLQLHEALLTQEARLDNAKTLEIAKSTGLDVDKLQLDMKSKTVEDALAANAQLAEKMHLMGTPAFIVAATPNGEFAAGTEAFFIPGAASEQTLQDLITKATGKK